MVFSNFFPSVGLLRHLPDPEFYISALKIKETGRPQNGALAHFSVINRAAAHCFKNFGHPGHKATPVLMGISM